MKNQSRNGTAVNLLAGTVFALAICAAQPPLAHATSAFTDASLKGRYAYFNNTGDVASLGPIEFNGAGKLTLRITTNLPCAVPAPGCARTVSTFDAEGTYSIEPDGSGIAIVGFPAPTGPVTYNLMISKSVKRGAGRLATEVVSAGQTGGLAGQLIAPTLTLQSSN
jgi:hypothetical protein